MMLPTSAKNAGQVWFLSGSDFELQSDTESLNQE